ncbi:MAG: MFS transporter [Methanobacteriota archaeon]|nr:MAG: MFS transporter [Euryarchaeota archaeon]
MSNSVDLKLELWLANSGSAVLFSFLVLYLKEVGLSEFQIAMLSLSYSISMICSNALFGRLTDSIGPRPFLVLGLFLSAITSYIYVMADGFNSFFLMRMIHGIALGMYPASITAVASGRGTKLGSLSSFGSLGWATGSIIAGFVAQYTGLQNLFLLSFSMFFVSFLLSVVFKSGASAVVEKKEDKKKFGKALRANWKIYLMASIRHGTANSIWIYWALFLTQDIGLSTSQVGWIQLTNTLTQFFVMGKVGDRFNPLAMFIAGNFLSAMTFFSFTLASNFWQMLLTQMMLGVSWAFLYVGGLRLVEESGKTFDGVGTSTGLYNSSFSVAQAIGPILAIYFFDQSHDYTLAMKMAALITFSFISIFTLDALKTIRANLPMKHNIPAE